MQETLTLAQLHALLAAVPATAGVLVEIDGLSFEMFELEICDGRAVLALYATARTRRRIGRR